MSVRGRIVELRINSGSDLARLADDLRAQAGPAMRARFTKELRGALKPAVPAVRRAALSIPAHGPKHTGLRQRIAKSAALGVRTNGSGAGANVVLSPERMPNGEKGLPAYMEGIGRPWRHPVYGDDNKWVSQAPHPFFYKTMEEQVPAIKRGIEQMLDRIAKDIS